MPKGSIVSLRVLYRFLIVDKSFFWGYKMKRKNKLRLKKITSVAFGLFSTTFMSLSGYADEIDILIIYDSELNDFYDGSPSTSIRSIISTTNTYFANSNVDIQLNMVGAALVDGLGHYPDDVSGNSVVSGLRDNLGADLVAYVDGGWIGACGRGTRTTGPDASAAYSLVSRICMTHSFAHEIGHNMGLGHSLTSNDTGLKVYDYGLGYGVNDVFSTMMSYSSDYNVSDRTYRFSNPDYNCSGYTCGAENEADAARALNNVVSTVAGHRSSGGTVSYVSMRKQNSNSYAIDGAFGSADSQNVYIWTNSATNINQHWEEHDRGDGYYSYRKRGTNHCIDGGNGGENGQNVYLWTCSTSNYNQHWRKVNISGRYRLEKRNASDYSIDGGNGGANGQNLYLWESSNTNQNQQWVFTDR